MSSQKIEISWPVYCKRLADFVLADALKCERRAWEASGKVQVLWNGSITTVQDLFCQILATPHESFTKSSFEVGLITNVEKAANALGGFGGKALVVFAGLDQVQFLRLHNPQLQTPRRVCPN